MSDKPQLFRAEDFLAPFEETIQSEAIADLMCAIANARVAPLVEALEKYMSLRERWETTILDDPQIDDLADAMEPARKELFAAYRALKEGR